ncbi:MAG: FAD:protein FMN transferase [Rhodoglobus sp.]
MPWHIDILPNTLLPEPTDAEIDPLIAAAVAARIEIFDRTYSRFRSDSLVTTIATTPGSYRFPPDAAALFELYRRLYTATSGAMSPLVGHALEELGYDRHYRLQPTAARTRIPPWHEAISINDTELTTHSPVLLDVGAAGKGHLVDIVAGVLNDHGVDTMTVDASGDILHRGARALRVALEHPLDRSTAIGVLNITNQSICASASNRRSWAGVHHILDARTGLPTEQIIATWAIAATTLDADGLATALFFTEPAALATEYEFQYVRMFASGRVEFSPHLDGEIFLEQAPS